MARPLRIEYPGAWYHVMNRGADHQNIFFSTEDYQLFLDLLSSAHQTYQVEIHTYCLMSNHYHLLIRTPQPNLSRVMQHIDGVYTQKFNKINEKDGSLFRGRYKSILIEAESYLINLSRYIHMNPNSAGIVKTPANYEWSSYSYFLKMKPKPDWLYCDTVLSYFNHEPSYYKNFVLQEADSEVAEIFERKRKPAVIGSQKFIETIKNQKLQLISSTELPQYSELKRMDIPSIGEVIRIVAGWFNVGTEKILIKETKAREFLPRKIAIYLAYQMTGQSQKTIAKTFNDISYARVAQIVKQITIDMGIDSTLEEKIYKIKQLLKGAKGGQILNFK